MFRKNGEGKCIAVAGYIKKKKRMVAGEEGGAFSAPGVSRRGCRGYAAQARRSGEVDPSM